MMGDRAVPAVPAEEYPCSVNASVAAVCRPIAPVTFAFSARGSGQAFRVFDRIVGVASKVPSFGAFMP